MATVLPSFTTLSSYPGIYTDQPSDGPDTTDISQPDGESEFFEGAQSIINEAYGDTIRGWGNAIMANAVSMDDVPEFLREQVQGYIDYTTGQTEEVVEDITQDTVEAEQDEYVPESTPEPQSPEAPVPSSRQPGESLDGCKKRYRDQIDEIDAEMQTAFSPEQGTAYKERLLVLTKQLRACSTQ